MQKPTLTYNHKLSQASECAVTMDNKFSLKQGPFDGNLAEKIADQKSIGDGIDFHPVFFETENKNHSEFLQKQGEMKLLSGDIKGLKLFEHALELDPKNTNLIYRQATALYEYGASSKTKKYLLLANKKFKAALQLNPLCFASWSGWGNSLSLLGKTFGNHHYFIDAREKLQKAAQYAKGQTDESVALVYWNLGQVLTATSDHSGEVSDLTSALEAYGKASSLCEQLPARFWNDFGRVSLKLGAQINDINLYLKAINCQKNAISKSLSSFDSWFLLADTLMQFYTLTHDEDHFSQANECFISAAKLEPDNTSIWISWAKLLMYSGKRLKDVKRLFSAIEKCHKAHSCKPKDESTITLWAETLALLGSLSDRLDLISEAENKIAEAMDQFGQTPEVCYAHGVTLYAYGTYYSDADYYYQAIEKFQEGLSINRVNHKLWFHLGHTYRIIAEIEDDHTLFHRAAKFCARAINLQPASTYYYEYALSLSKLSEYNPEKETIENALIGFEQAFSLQKNAIYLHPEWLFEYANTLDLMGDLQDDDKYYIKAIEILKRVLMLDPDFDGIHYRIALTYMHLGELSDEVEMYHRALTHYKIAFNNNEENEQLILDWSLALIHLSQVSPYAEDREQYLKEAEFKLIQSAKLGNTEVYYHLCCLYSLMKHFEKAMYFLEKAEHFDALPPLEEVLEDIWLENLRQTEVFKAFISHLHGCN